MEYVISCYTASLAFSWVLGFEGLSGRDTHKNHFIHKLIWFLSNPWNFVYHNLTVSERKMEASSAWVGLMSCAAFLTLLVVHFLGLFTAPLWLWLPPVGGSVGFGFWVISTLKDY